MTTSSACSSGDGVPLSKALRLKVWISVRAIRASAIQTDVVPVGDVLDAPCIDHGLSDGGAGLEQERPGPGHLTPT